MIDLSSAVNFEYQVSIVVFDVPNQASCIVGSLRMNMCSVSNDVVASSDVVQKTAL